MKTKIMILLYMIVALGLNAKDQYSEKALEKKIPKALETFNFTINESQLYIDHSAEMLSTKF